MSKYYRIWCESVTVIFVVVAVDDCIKENSKQVFVFVFGGIYSYNFGKSFEKSRCCFVRLRVNNAGKYEMYFCLIPLIILFIP